MSEFIYNEADIRRMISTYAEGLINNKALKTATDSDDTTLPPLARFLTTDGGVFDPKTELLLVKKTLITNNMCLFCSDECDYISNCCGATLCPDCVETEDMTHCVNCGDALHSIRHFINNAVVLNGSFQGTEPRHLEITGRIPRLPNFGWIDFFGKSHQVVVAKKNISVNNSIWTTILRNDENRIYYGFRPKCV